MRPVVTSGLALLLCLVSLSAAARNVTDDNATAAQFEASQTPGILMQLSQRGLNYLSNVSSEALPIILTNYAIDDSDDSSYSIRDLKIEHFERPIIDATFLDNVGIRAKLILPKTKVIGTYEGGVAWWKKKGKFRSEITNLHLNMTLAMRPAVDGKPDIEVLVCNGSTDDMIVVFGGQFSGLLNAMRGFVEKYLVEELDNIICDLAVQAAVLAGTSAVEEQRASDNSTAVQAIVDAAVEGQTGRRPKLDPMLLCAQRELNRRTGEAASRAGGGQVLVRAAAAMEGGGGGEGLPFTMDFGIVVGPRFTSNSSLLGIDGGLRFAERRADHVYRPEIPEPELGSQMISFMIHEYVPNTFFAHLYRAGLGVVHQTVTADALPRAARFPLKLMCRRCKLKLAARLTGQPEMQISPRGVTLYIEGKVRAMLDAPFKKVLLIHSDAKFYVTVKPYIRRSRVFGYVSLSSVDIQVRDVGVGGFLGNILEEALDFLVPRKLWPKIKKRLRFALHRRGIKLPTLCGVQLDNPKLRYVPHAMIIDTDFRYHLTEILRANIQLQKGLSSTVI